MIVVEGSDKDGNRIYKAMVKEILSELGIGNAIERVYLKLEPSMPIVIVSIKTKKTRPPVKVKDVALIETIKEGCRVLIRDEIYGASLLSTLWSKCGRKRVEQSPDRIEITCKGIKSSEMAELLIKPGEKLKEETLNAIWEILPEGFRVRRSFVSDDTLTTIATEDPMKEEWIAEGKKIHENIRSLQKNF